jgi:prepilin-type N-terminal cleavage/methylation domain-containing protein
MKRIYDNNFDGFTLLEVMVTIAIVGALASIAIPHYQSYAEQARAAQCQTKRYHIEMEERGYYLDHDEAGLQINDTWSCPSGGVYVWLVSDPDDPGYPQVGCSVHYAPSPSPPTAETLFSSNFDDMEGLTPLRGSWENRDGTLVPTGRAENRLAFGDTDWEDYELSVNADLSEGKGYGIYFRADGDRKISGYCFQYDPGYGKGAFLVRKIVNGKEQSPLQRVWIPDGFPVYNQSHDTTITTMGDHHVIKVDGEEIFNFHDNTFSSGSAGLRSWGKSVVGFQDATVSQLK